MEKVQIKAKERTLKTKSETKTLRKDGMIPGVYYSKHDTPISIGISQNALNPLVFTKETHLISLQMEDDRQFDCIIKDVQFDPVSDKVVHFDLLGLTSGETFQLEVPIKYIGSPVGIKEGGVLQQFLHKLDVECLPKDIPQHLEINIQGLNIGDSIHVSDLNYEGLTLLNPDETVIVSVTHAKVEVEPVAEEAVEGEEESAEPEVIGKGKADKEKDEEEED